MCTLFQKYICIYKTQNYSREEAFLLLREGDALISVPFFSPFNSVLAVTIACMGMLHPSCISYLTRLGHHL